MNQHDIELLAKNKHECPNVQKAVGLLYRLLLYVNQNSDGWAYWPIPSQASQPLQQLLKDRCGNLWYDTTGTITNEELKKAVSPIKRMATIQRKKQLSYGNKFEFDVAAALAPINS
jgi:hypothetical protein